MLAIDVGDDREDRRELQKRSIALIRFHHQKIALADARVRAAHRRDLAADHHGGVDARVTQDGRDHRSGGGLAVAARDGDAVFQAHQLGEKFSARNHGNLQPARFLHFGIRFLHGRTDHQRLRAGDIFRVVAFVNPSRRVAPADRWWARASDPNRRSCNPNSAALRRYRSCRFRRFPQSGDAAVKKTFLISIVSAARRTVNRFFEQNLRRAPRRARMREFSRALAHRFQRARS